MSSMQQLVDRLAEQGYVAKSDDLEQQQQEWLRDLDNLMDTLEGWLKPGVEKGVFRVSREQETLAEEDWGEYETPALRIRTFASTIRVRPRGLRILGAITDSNERVVGARGRVDITLGPARVMLLRFVESDGASSATPASWKLVGDDRNETKELTEEALAEALESLLG